MAGLLKTPLSLALLLAAGATAALAETRPFAAEGAAGEAAEGKAILSPFEFAASGGKAGRDAAAAEADPAGSKVIGGQKAEDGAWPWQVALTVASKPVGTDSQFCGGSLVLDQWVLTAAHCVHMMDDKGEGQDIKPDELAIVVGTNRLDGSGDRVPVDSVWVHPSYSVNDLDYDIALVRLARKPTAPYRTIEIPDASYGDLLREPGITTVVTGWGLQNGGKPAAELQQAQIQMLDRDMCNNIMMDARAEEAVEGFAYAAQVMSLREEQAYAIWDQIMAAAPMPLSENMICSGTFEGGKTSCNGDSGGPLVVPLENGNYIQAGIVSWGLSSTSGRGCAEDAQFSTYVDVSRFVPWLNEVIAANP